MTDTSQPDETQSAPPRRTRHDVFLSYSSKNKAVADAVCATLEQRGLRCWMAPRDITPGAEWAASIVQAISDSRAFVLIFSAFANTSSQVKREVERAANQSLPIIPFRIDDVPPNQTLEFFISTPHWLDALTPPLEAHAEHLARVVERLLDDKPPADLAEAAREQSYKTHPPERPGENRDEDRQRRPRRSRRHGPAQDAREQTLAAIAAVKRSRRRLRDGEHEADETGDEVSREIGKAVDQWRDYARRVEDAAEDDRPPETPVLAPLWALALGLALYIAPQLIVPLPPAEAWRFAPLFMIPVALSLWGLRFVNIAGGFLIVGGSVIAAQAASMLAGRVFTFMPHAASGHLDALETARVAGVGAAVFAAAVLALLIVFGRRLANPAALRLAVIHCLGLPALAAGLGYGFYETQEPAGTGNAWLAFVFYGLWLLALGQAVFSVASTRFWALLGNLRPSGPPPTDDPARPREHRRNHRQVWLVGLFTLIGIVAVTVVTVGPPIPFGPRAAHTTTTPPY